MTSATSSTANASTLTSVPNVAQSTFNLFLQVSNTGDQPNTRDDAGLPIVYGSCKLLDMLGYGSLIASNNASKAAITKKYLGLDTLSDANNPLVYQSSQTVNALPFLAYQKIYYDFFSNNQWEKHKAYAYNVDYWSGTGNISLVTDMVQLRYANYPKDYFMGMLPNSQYGSVAVLPCDGEIVEERAIVDDSRVQWVGERPQALVCQVGGLIIYPVSYRVHAVLLTSRVKQNIERVAYRIGQERRPRVDDERIGLRLERLGNHTLIVGLEFLRLIEYDDIIGPTHASRRITP